MKILCAGLAVISVLLAMTVQEQIDRWVLTIAGALFAFCAIVKRLQEVHLIPGGNEDEAKTSAKTDHKPRRRSDPPHRP